MMKLKCNKCVIHIYRDVGGVDELKCAGRSDECPKMFNKYYFDVECLIPDELED